MSIKALIFDFDGLIIDSESPEYQVWRDVFAEHGRELELDFWSDLVGRPPNHFDLYGYFHEHVNPTIDIEAFRRQRRARVVALTEQQPVLPGVHDYLREATEAGMKIGLASSSSGSHVRGHLARLELLHYFHTTKCFGPARTSPIQRLISPCARQVGVMPAEAIAFEDSPNGVTRRRPWAYFALLPVLITQQLRWTTPIIAWNRWPPSRCQSRAPGGGKNIMLAEPVTTARTFNFGTLNTNHPTARRAF
jgi:beta-phosphoglucomutase-like phosphatase (HAD superfamily)